MKTERILNCLHLASEAHWGQKRKFNGLDYIVHPVQVAEMVEEELKRVNIYDSYKENMICASLLHDVLEDCPDIPEDRIEYVGGSRVLEIVKELTHVSQSEGNRATRKAKDRVQLKNASWEARFIKLCDRICNVRDMIKECPDKFLQVYLYESQLLLTESLFGTDVKLEEELEELINSAN